MSPRKRGEGTKSDPAPPASLRVYKRKRNFARTPEPSGAGVRRPSRRKTARHGASAALAFVIQKHAASHLHFDFRLELDGVMKSWAVPKGPSLDPSVKRLAMEVEDHPMDYNSFEGTIPKGEYGGGTVMLWDRGTYTADRADGDPVTALRAGYKKGDLKIWLDGERLRGAWVLRRIKAAPSGGSGERAQWLLIKRHDEFTEPGSDVVAAFDTSVESGCTMDEIAEGKGKKKVWRSNRQVRGPRSKVRLETSERSPATAPTRTSHPSDLGPGTSDLSQSLQPMLATIGEGVPIAEGWAFEPKYDGIRVLAYAAPTGAAPAVTLVTRNLKDKSRQFPEIVDAIGRLAGQLHRPIVLDGEIVAVDEEGKPARFQALQSRMHVMGQNDIDTHATDTPSAFYAFDVLLDGDEILVHEPWSTRRGRLEQLLRSRTTPRLRLAESFPNDGERMVEHARRMGWEGVIAKRMNSRYEPGVRSRAWIKLKIEHRQEFVVGGWTEPRNSRQHLGALLLGYYDGDRFIYVGHTGGGLDAAALRDMAERLAPLERSTSPFATPVKTNERAHWVKPEVVVEVKFSQWTADGKLRHPIFIGVRDDKGPRDVVLERPSVQGTADSGLRIGDLRPREASRPRSAARGPKRSAIRNPQSAGDDAVADLTRIQREGGDGVVASLDVSNLNKVFFPEDGITKGDLMRYYARMAPFVLPALADRPLVLKRYPNGIHGKAFYQQRAPDDVPAGVRVETVRNDEGEEQARIIGGDILTLLWTVQLGAISVDPWLSRVQTCDEADFAIIDLDPGPEATFRRVVDVGRWTKEELDELGLHAAVKTSGATGLHICLPLPAKTSYETAQTLAQLVATRVAERHLQEVTLERSVKARPADAVYADYLQNIRGKTVAGPYAVRARRGAPVSAPLDWSELTDDLDPDAFTIETMPARAAKVGDIWAAAIRKKNTLARLRRVADSG